jgi:hypothetical protein
MLPYTYVQSYGLKFFDVTFLDIWQHCQGISFSGTQIFWYKRAFCRMLYAYENKNMYPHVRKKNEMHVIKKTGSGALRQCNATYITRGIVGRIYTKVIVVDVLSATCVNVKIYIFLVPNPSDDYAAITSKHLKNGVWNPPRRYRIFFIYRTFSFHIRHLFKKICYRFLLGLWSTFSREASTNIAPFDLFRWRQ